MEEKTLKILNKLGLHARAAALFVQVAGKYTADIKLIKDGVTVNGKSIMGVMMLAAAKGSTVSIVADGPDEADLIKELEELINNKFGEE